MEVDEDAGGSNTNATRKGVLPAAGKEEGDDQDDEEAEIVADDELVEHPQVDQPGQVDANGDVTRCICGREGMCLSRPSHQLIR